MGVDKLKSLARGLAGAMNAVHSYKNGGGLIGLLFALKDVVPAFAVDYKVALAELKDLSELEREAVEAEFKSGLVDALKGVVGKFVDAAEEVADLVEDVLASGKVFYGRGKALYEKLKAMV